MKQELSDNEDRRGRSKDSRFTSVQQEFSDISDFGVWKEFAKHFRRKETADAYMADIREFEQVCAKKILDAGAEEAAFYYDWLSKRADAGEISGSTLGKKLWELHSFAAFAAEKQGMYGVPPDFTDCFFSWLRVAGQKEKLVQSVPVEDLDALYQVAQENLMAYTIITLIHRIGLSSREIGDLKPEDFSEYENGSFVSVRGRDELCYIPPDVVQIIELYLSKRDAVEYLFYNRNGNPLNKMYISRLLKKYTEKAGIPSLSAEKIRTTCGITMYAYGLGVRQVARQMGITGTQIKKYQNIQYKDNLSLKANELVKIKVDPPGNH